MTGPRRFCGNLDGLAGTGQQLHSGIGAGDAQAVRRLSRIRGMDMQPHEGLGEAERRNRQPRRQPPARVTHAADS